MGTFYALFAVTEKGYVDNSTQFCLMLSIAKIYAVMTLHKERFMYHLANDTLINKICQVGGGISW